MFVYGINHQTTPIHIREKFAFNTTQLPAALQSLISSEIANEAVILSTCNRTEIYCDQNPLPHLTKWLAHQKSIDESVLEKYTYVFQHKDAIRHLMRVASGLDSVILGEPQVLGQIKQAYQAALTANTIGDYFKLLFPSVFEAVKDIRSNTDVGAHPVSIAYTIAQLVKKIFPTLTDCRVMLIGAGEMIELIATHLNKLHVAQLIIANRTIEKTQLLSDVLQCHPIHIQEIPTHIVNCDVVISATASQLPILGKGLIESTMQKRDQRPLLLFDLAIPRDMEPEVATLKNVHLMNIDELQQRVEQHQAHRSEAAKEAEIIIDHHLIQFEKKTRVYNARHVISEYRNRLDIIRFQEQEKALYQLQQGQDPHAVIEQFGQNLINKIMHHPTIKLREAASEENHCELFHRIKTFFELQ